MKNLTKLLVLMLVSFSCTAEAVKEGNYLRHEEGYFWYKDEPEPPPKPPEPKPVVPPAPPAEPKAPTPPVFSVEWLKANIEALKTKAIDDPSTENVKNYLYAQRAMFDKSEAFADKAAEVARFDPLLDENNRVPISNNAVNWANGIASRGKTAAVDYLGTKGGLWFFFDSKCVHCVYQYETIKNFAARHKYTVWNISTDGKGLPGMDKFVRDKGQFKSLNLSLTPSIIFAVPPANMFVVAQGAMSVSELEDRILTAAMRQNLIPEEMRKTYAIYERGRMTADDFKDSGNMDLSTSDEWVKYMQEKLRRRY